MIVQESLQSIEYNKNQNSIKIKLEDVALANEDLAKLFQKLEIAPQSIKHLYLHDNKLEEISIQQFKNLETLSLKNNPLDEIPPDILQLKKLKYLFIDEIQLKNSLETILKLRNLEEVNIWDGKKYFTIPFKLLSVLGESNQTKKIRWNIDRLQKILRRKDEAKKYLDTLARRIFTLLVIIISFLVIWIAFINIISLAKNWDAIEPYKEIISFCLIVLFGIFARALGKTIMAWLDDNFLEMFQKIIYLIVGFKYKEYRKFEEDLEKCYVELDENSDQLIPN